MLMTRWPFSTVILLVAMSILLLPRAQGAFAQVLIARPPSAVDPADKDLSDTRARLLSLLRMSPTLSQVVTTDPTLLGDKEYVDRNNPQLAQFLAQHPEVTRNPGFDLFADIPGQHGRRADNLIVRVGGNDPSNVDLRRWLWKRS